MFCLTILPTVSLSSYMKLYDGNKVTIKILLLMVCLWILHQFLATDDVINIILATDRTSCRFIWSGLTASVPKSGWACVSMREGSYSAWTTWDVIGVMYFVLMIWSIFDSSLVKIIIADDTSCYSLKGKLNTAIMNTSTYTSANNLTVNLTEYSGIMLFIGAVPETDQLDSGIMLYNHREPTPFWFFAYCCTAIVLGVILNTLTITVLKMGRRIGEDVKFQLINLAIADLLTACCLPTWYMVNYLITSSDYVALEEHGYRMCQVIIWVVLGITAASPLLNMLISL